jgi:acetylornithine/succinyldiaminopimelate/putrescine aminotransferase/predicted amino acid dehydrogenase
VIAAVHAIFCWRSACTDSSRMADSSFAFNNPELRRLMRLCRLDHTFVHGEGVWLTDADGRRYLDAYAQYGAVALGHAAREVAAAVRAALDARVPAMVQPYLAAQAEALGEALAAAAPGHPRRCVLATSGAEAVEAALKLVRARSGRSLVLAATGAYHGKTLGALSLTGRAEHAEGFGPLAPGFDHVPFGDADALEARLARAPGPFAALFLEPIQGEGGVIVPPAGYLARARELCSRHGVALVVDEIQTGLGRTGRLFACEAEAVTPDVLLIGKGLGGGLFPLSACLVADAWWDERFALGHSSTFANNNVAAAVALAVLRALAGDGDRAGLVANAAARGERLGAGLRRLAARYPRVVAEARGRGLLWALELRPADEAQGLLLGFLQHQGLYAYAAAAVLAEQSSVLALPTLGTANVLRIAPPLVVSDEEIDLIVDAIESMCGKLARNPCETIVRNLGWLRPDRDDADPEGRAHRPPATPAPVPPPPPARARDGHRRWAFLIHYTRPEDVRVTEPGLARLSDDEIAAYCGHVGELPAGLCLRTPVIRSPATGAEADGLIIALPLLAEEMMRRGRRAMAPAIGRAVDLAVQLGADVVGLGGFTAPLSDRGVAVTGRGVPVTTGNALTAAAAFEAARAELLARGLAIADASIAVLGARGSVGALMARLAARERPRQLLLIGSPHGDPARLAALARELAAAGAPVLTSGDGALVADCDLVLSATGAARPVLDALPLAPGTIVCDVARPHDAGPAVRGRADLTVIDGGLIVLPDPDLGFGPGNLQGLPRGIALACLSETILHALEGTRRDHGVGDNVPLEHADQALALCRRHGFRVALRGAARLDADRAQGGGAR